MSVDGTSDTVYACDECGEPLKPHEHFRCFTCQQQWLESLCTRERAYVEPQPNDDGEDMVA